MLKTLIILIAGLIQSSCALAFDWQDLWLTPDQQGQKLMDKGDYQQAATRFTSPERIGTALYLAGEFEQAVSVLGRADTSDAHYNRGNAHIMLGQYDAAIAAYQRALSARPDWHAAEQNLEIAQLRKLSLAPPEDDFGGTGGMLEADEIVFNQEGRNFDSATEQVVDAADQPMDDKSMRAMWLRKVETRPSEFLAVRFRYQQATRVQTTPVGKSPTTGEDND